MPATERAASDGRPVLQCLCERGGVGEHDADGSGRRGGSGIAQMRSRKQRMEIVVQEKGMSGGGAWNGMKGCLIGGRGAALAGAIGVGWADKKLTVRKVAAKGHMDGSLVDSSGGDSFGHNGGNFLASYLCDPGIHLGPVCCKSYCKVRGGSTCR